MLRELNQALDMLAQEERRVADVQDPRELTGRGHTNGRAGPRRLIASEIVENELERSDKQMKQAPAAQQQTMSTTKSAMTVVDLTSPLNTPRRPSRSYNAPFFTTFSRTGDIIRSSHRVQPPSTSMRMLQEEEDNEIIVTGVWPAEEVQAEANIMSSSNNSAHVRHQNKQLELSNSTSSFQPHRQ